MVLKGKHKDDFVKMTEEAFSKYRDEVAESVIQDFVTHLGEIEMELSEMPIDYTSRQDCVEALLRKIVSGEYDAENE